MPRCASEWVVAAGLVGGVDGCGWRDELLVEVTSGKYREKFENLSTTDKVTGGEEGSRINRASHTNTCFIVESL